MKIFEGKTIFTQKKQNAEFEKSPLSSKHPIKHVSEVCCETHEFLPIMGLDSTLINQ